MCFSTVISVQSIRIWTTKTHFWIYTRWQQMLLWGKLAFWTSYKKTPVVAHLYRKSLWSMWKVKVLLIYPTKTNLQPGWKEFQTWLHVSSKLRSIFFFIFLSASVFIFSPIVQALLWASTKRLDRWFCWIKPTNKKINKDKIAAEKPPQTQSVKRSEHPVSFSILLYHSEVKSLSPLSFDVFSGWMFYG